MLMAVILGGVIGAAIPQFFPMIMLALINQKHLNHSTRRKAESAFLEEEVFNTRHRTGIMIFISFFEREVIVMADRGISKVVDQKLWDNIVADLVKQIRLGKIVEGLEGAIKRCGELLLEKGFTITQDDVNELRDDLRIE
jgi:putative membrane protein